VYDDGNGLWINSGVSLYGVSVLAHGVSRRTRRKQRSSELTTPIYIELAALRSIDLAAIADLASPDHRAPYLPVPALRCSQRGEKR